MDLFERLRCAQVEFPAPSVGGKSDFGTIAGFPVTVNGFVGIAPKLSPAAEYGEH